LQPNASGAKNTNEPPNSLVQLLDSRISENAPLSDRVAVLGKVTKLMEFTKPQGCAFSQVKLPTFSGNDDLHGTAMSSAYFLPLVEWLRRCELSLSASPHFIWLATCRALRIMASCVRVCIGLTLKQQSYIKSHSRLSCIVQRTC
jgi:hypothetical protein